MNAVSFEQLAEIGGGFELWRTRDGVNWHPVSLNGLGNPYNYGGRTMVSTPVGLAIGTANPFGGESPARFASRWKYFENPDGGTEVFVGNANHRPYTLPAPRRLSQTDQSVSGDGVDLAITGATGFIGRSLMPELLAAKYRVRILVQPGTGDALPHHPLLEQVEGGLEDLPALEELVKGARVVLHMAARLAGSCDVAKLRQTNVDGTHDLLRACMKVPELSRVVFFSSVAAYQRQFDQTHWPIHESYPLRVDGGEDLSDYGMTKVAGENLTRHYSRVGGFEHVILRFALVYGVGDPLVDPMIRDDAPLPDFGQGPQGAQPRQFVHIRDAVHAILRACFLPEARHETFNIAGPDVVTYRELGRLTRIALGLATFDDQTPDTERIWRRYLQQYDVTRARERLGFRPAIHFSEGLRDIVDHHRGSGARTNSRAASAAPPRERSIG
jgi:nucleoside-diphosphate-sugar epimerase